MFHLISIKFRTNQQSIKDKPEGRGGRIRQEMEEIEAPKGERKKGNDKKKKEKKKIVKAICEKDVKETVEKKIVESIPIP